MIQNKIKNLAIATKLYWSNSRVIQDSSLLYISNLVTAGVGFLSSVIVARVLGPSEFAVIAAYNSIVLTLIGFTDFGLGTALIKHATPYINKNRTKAAEYIKTVFYLEILIGIILLMGGLLLAPLLPKLLGQGELSLTVVRLAVVSASITSAAAFVAATLATYKKFKTNAIISIIYGSLKLITTVILWKTSNLSIANILALFIFLSIFNAAIGFLVVPKDYLIRIPKERLKKAAKSIFHFSIWLTLSFFITSVMGKLDFFYILGIKGSESAGIYASAQQLSQVYILLLGAIGTVLTSHVSEKIDYKSMVGFLKKSLPVSAVLATLFILSGIIAPVVINLIFGIKYSGAAQPLQLLIIHLALNVILLPVSLLFIPLGKVKVGTFIVVAQLVASLLLYPLFINRYGINGAALTVICTTLIGAIIYPISLVHYLKIIKRGEFAKTIS